MPARQQPGSPGDRDSRASLGPAVPTRSLRPSVCAALLLVAACASPVRTTELARIDERSGYRYAALDQRAPKSIDKSAVIMTFSGGGTRAAALADGALRALAATEVPGMAGRVPLASQIDVVSSVSGGSVTAGIFCADRHRWAVRF